MERIGDQRTWSFMDGATEACTASNRTIRNGKGHLVETYFELAMKVAELQFLNRDYVLMFRGQRKDYQTERGSSLLKATIFRNDGKSIPSGFLFKQRFDKLRQAERALVDRYRREEFKGLDRLQRHRIIRWAILQHYRVCDTPLLDVTTSLRIAASFASDENDESEAFVFIFAVPNISGAVTASSEASLQIIRLSSACPPDAVRPHIQEGYLLGEYPEIADLDQKNHYKIFEMDFGRRLIAKFRFNPKSFWSSRNFPRSEHDALYPTEKRDRLLPVADKIRAELTGDTA